MNEAVSKPSDILEEGSSTQSSGTVVPQVNSETVDSSVLNGDPYENSSHKQENENLTPKKVVILDPAFGQDPDSEEDDSVSHAAGRSKAIATENAATSTSGQITDPSIAAAEDRKKAREERRKEREKKKEEEMLKKYHAEQEAKQKISAKSKCGRWIKHNLKLGKGGYKFVYRGYDTMEAKNIAWCEFKREHVDTREKRQAMFRETEIMLKMNHPHIVRCFDVFREWIDMEDPNNPMEEKGVVIIQELMEGGTLKSAIRKNFSEGHCILKFSLITRWWHQILDALRYMHHRIQPPILHRDLKADNCFLYGAADGECLNVKVGDFGLATHVNNSGRKTMLGTLGFMAPEIFDENYDEKVDIYAFGMLMLEVMTNRTPYDECETVMQVAAKTMSGRGPDIMDKVMNPTLREVIGACIHPLTCFRPTAEELYFHPLFQPKTLLVEVEPNYDVERNEVFDRFIRSLAQPETRNPNFNLRLRFRDKKMLQELGLDDGESLEFDLDIYKAEDQDIPDLIHNLRLCYEDKLSRVFENPKQPDKKIVSSHLDKLFNSIRLQMQFLVKILLGKRWKQILDSLIQELQTRKKPEGSSAAAEGNDSDTDEGTSSFTLIGQYKTRWGRAKRMLEREIQAYRNGTTTVAPSTTIPSTQPSTTVSTVLANVQAKSVTSDPASSTLSNPITLQPSVNVIGATEETDSSSRGPVAVTTVGKFLISTPVSPSVGPSATPVQSGSPDLPSDPTQTQQTEPQLQTITATIPSQSLADALNETRPVQQLLSGAPPAQPVSLVSTASSQSYTQPLTTTLESQPLATDMDSASPAALDGVAQSAALLHQLLQGITASSSKGADPSHADVKQALAQLGTLAPQPGVGNQNSQAAQQQQQQQLLLAAAAMVAAAEQTAPHTSSSSAAPTDSEVQYAPHEKILHTQTGGSESIAAQQQQQLPPVNPSQVAAAQQPSNMDEVTSPTESQSAAEQMDRKPRKKSRSKPRHVLRVTKVERDPEGSEQGTLRPTFYLEMPDPENPNSELWKLSFRCNLSDTTEDIKLFEGHTRVNQEIDRAAKEAIVQILGALRSDVNSVKINQDYIFYPHPVTLSSAENVVSGGQPSAGLPHSIPPVQFSVPPQIATNPNITPVDAQSEPSQPAILPPFFSVAPVTPSYDAPTVSQSKQPHQSNLSVDSNMPFLQHPISEVDAHSTEGEEVGENLPMYTSLEPHLIHQPYENIPDPASFPRPAEAASYTPYFSASSCSSSQGIPLLQNIPAPSSHFEQPASKASQLALGLQYVQDLLSSLIGRSVDQGKAAPSEEQLSLEEVASVIPAVLNEPVIASLPSYDSSSQADINTSECTSYSRVDSRSVNLQPDTNVTAPAQPTVYASVPFSQLPVSNMMVNLNCTVPAKMELVLKEVVYRLCNAPHLPHVVLPTGSRTTDTSHATPSLKVVDIPDGHIFLGSGHDGCFNLTTFKSPSDPAFVLLGDSRTSGDLSSPHLYRIPPDSAVVLSPNGAVHYLNKAALVVPGHSHEIHRGASVSTSPVSELTDGTRPSQYSSSVHVRELPIQPNMDNLTIDDVLNLLLALRSTPQSFRRSNNTSPTSEAGFLSSPPLATDPHASVSTFSRRGSVLSGPIHISQQALQEHQLSLGQQLRSLQSHFHGQTGSFLPAEQGFPVVCQSHAFKPTQPSSIEAQNMQVGPIHREWSVDHTASRQNSVHMGTSVVPLNMRNLQHSSTVAIGATPGVHYPSQSRQPSRHQILPQSGARDLNVTALQRAIQILSSLNSSLPYDQLHNVNHPIPRVQTTHSAFVPNLTHPQMRGPPSSTRPVAPSQPSGCTSPPSHPPSASSQFRLFNPVGFAPSDSALDLSAAVSASLDPGRPPTSHPVHPSVVSANSSSQLSATQLRKQPSAFELHSASQQQSLSSLAGLQQMIHPDLLNALLLIQKQSEVHRDMLANLPSDQQSRVISNTVQSQAGRVPSQQPGSTAHSSVLQVAPGGAQAGGSDFSKIQATDQRQQSNTPGSTIPTAPITVANKFTVVPVKSENEEPVIPSVLPNNMLQPPPRPPRQRPAVSQAVPNANPSSVAVDLGSYTALGSAPTTSAISPSLVPNAVPSSGIAVKPPSDDQQSITQVKPLQAKATIDPRNQPPQPVTGTNPQNRSTSSTMPQPSTHPPTRPS